MKHSMKRRMRALATVSACMLAAMAAAKSTVPEESAMERLRAAVDGEAARLRASLDDAEATRDWADFLERKCTVDAAFAPLHLLLDAMEWQLPGVSNDLLRSMRTEWRDAPVTVQWSHPDGDARARQSLAAWVPAPDGGQAVRVEFRTGSEAWVAGDAPPTIQWTAEGCWLDGHPSIHARCWWRLPVAEPVRFDFPLSADGFDLWWDHAGARLQDDRGNAHAERWRADALFNNPPEMYAAFDALRTVMAQDRRTQVGANAEESGTSTMTTTDVPSATGPLVAPGGDPDPQTTLRIRTVRTADGRLLRTERWHWHGPELRSVVIDQEPLRLHHHAEQGVEIVTELDGQERGRSPHRAASEVMQFPNGARIAIAFRAADPLRDRVAIDTPGATVPDRWVLSVDGSMRAWSDFSSIRVGSAELPETWTAERATVLAAQGTLHRAVADRIARAIELRSPTELHAAQGGIAAALAAADAGPTCAASEWELLAARLLDAGMDAECDALLAARWLAAAGTEGAATAVERRARAGGAVLADRMARIAGVSIPAGGAASAESAAAQIAAPSADTLASPSHPACDPSALPDGARRVHDAVRAAVMAVVHDAAERTPLLSSLCAACAAASSTLDAVDPVRAAALGADVRAALECGQLHGASADETSGDDLRFGSDVVRAAQQPAADPERTASMRSAWDRCADIAVDALREALREAGTAADGSDTDTITHARRTLRARRALVGNAFMPSLDALHSEMPVDPVSLRERIHPAVAAAVRRELRRAEVTATVLGGRLAAARADAGERRMAEAAIAAAAGAYMRWAAEGPARR